MAALLPAGLAPPVARAQETGGQVTAAEIRAIAREAYVYGFPMVDNLEAPPAIDFPTPLTPAEQKTSLEFFNQLNFGLGLCSRNPGEKELRERFARIGIGPGRTIDFAKLSPEHRKAYEAGIADAWADFAALKQRIEKGEVISGDVFGTREYLKNNYLYRMAAAVLGIYGNSKQEAMYPVFLVDADGQKLNGSNRYVLRFPPGRLPPVDAFWSLTMYDQPASLLVANPLNRYLLTSTMLEQFTYDPDGGLTLLVQNESPGRDRPRQHAAGPVRHRGRQRRPAPPAPLGPRVAADAHDPVREGWGGVWQLQGHDGGPRHGG
jgi:hypothetical protein